MAASEIYTHRKTCLESAMRITSYNNQPIKILDSRNKILCDPAIYEKANIYNYKFRYIIKTRDLKNYKPFCTAHEFKIGEEFTAADIGEGIQYNFKHEKDLERFKRYIKSKKR